MIRFYDHRNYDAGQIAREREHSISVVVPAKDEEAGIGLTVEVLARLRDAGAIDEVIVADDSTDLTPVIARQLGADVRRQGEVCKELGPPRGKGDAMWRGLQMAKGDIVCFVDADSADFGEHFVVGLVGPLVTGPAYGRPALVKGAYRRPFRIASEGVDLPEGGGRVTEIMAKPLLREFFPALESVRQPLSGEVAARRHVLEAVDFTIDWGVDIGILIDVYRAHGAHAIAQCDLGTRQNDHKQLSQLGPMAEQVLASVLARVPRGHVMPVTRTRPAVRGLLP